VASGITRMHVNRLTSLLRLPETVVEMIDRKLLASAHGYELVRIVSHLPDDEVIGLAESSRKPKRGEAFARSVENLREQINEILTHVQRPAPVRQGAPGVVLSDAPADTAEPVQPVPTGRRQQVAPVGPAVAVWEKSSGTQSASSLAPPVSLFEAAIRGTAIDDEDESGLPNGASVRPHVREIVQEIEDGTLQAEEVTLLRQALGQAVRE
jgi:hypothetical protein